MVYRPLSKGEPAAAAEEERESESPSMATAPVKSQPLHNFALPHLKWGKNQTSNQRCRKPSNESSRDNNRSSASEGESDGGDGGSPHKDQETVNQKSIAGSSTKAPKNRLPVCGSFAVKTETRVVVVEEGKSPNLVIRIPKGESKSKSGGGGGASVDGDGGERCEGEEPAAKPWNLRPRRSVVKINDNGGGGGGGAAKNGEMEERQENQQQQQPKSLRLRGFVEPENVEKKEKLRFSIQLEREEIEEDVFIMTGSRPHRRPKKRNRTVQKQLDNCFPGLWLAGITADSYDVPELPPKKQKS